MTFTAVTFTFRPVDPSSDAALLHSWMVQERARFWGMSDASVDDVRAAHEGIDASPQHEAFFGCVDGMPAFLMERYDPEADPIGAHFEARTGDVGMHVLVAPAETPVPGFTRAVLTAVMEFLFSDSSAERIVVEPDVLNEKMHVLNAFVGFEKSARVTLPDKQAWLSFCTRAQFDAARSLRPGA